MQKKIVSLSGRKSGRRVIKTATDTTLVLAGRHISIAEPSVPHQANIELTEKSEVEKLVAEFNKPVNRPKFRRYDSGKQTGNKR
jgi:hypothetical protein